ncbi:FAD-dependent oxidoreductase [Dictyobacter kobayashii]|uniref:Cyclic nucleotide-binding domain-containing protein n=1 Tax=Dictyobacter kobayashii TaxID=2014872 RepID=A0A402ATB3_9CHLR|nr:cyclic nucleotide-binding domain-containing thioredoxin-disulfide reductase [Dictyobacter kobayashii]GCE22337.1 hypothetical protein KDK_61370 [Dictyobacter kobayashii]
MITADLVAQVPLFSQLSKEQQQQIASQAADVRLQAGEWLIQEGELPSFFVLLDGSLEVIKHQNDVERVLDYYGPGSYFGELPLLLGSTAVASLRAHEASRVLRLDPIDFQTYILGIPSLGHELLKTMARRIKNLQELAVSNTPNLIQVIGYRWDPACHDVRDFLVRNHVPFTWLEPTDPKAQEHLQALGNPDVCPIIVLQNGVTLITPTLRQLAEQVGLQTTPTEASYDVAILGAGPAGLAAAVYGASEGLRTLLIDREAPGGQAGTSSRIENYLGFPSGLSGEELSHRALLQARRFGAEIIVARCVEGITLEADPHTIILDGDERINARAIVIATGVNWRRLAISGVEKFVGRGVYYGAARSEALSTSGKDVYLIGGGNSAGQAALFFANYASSVTLLVRGDSLEATMSHYLIEQLALKANVVVQVHCEVVTARGKDHLESIVVRDRQSGTEQTHNTDALFIFIGANAQTAWLPAAISRDEGGYILTGQDVLADKAAEKHWPLKRNPFLLETSVPGIFAAGDVRHGSIKRVASGVGEGSMSIAFIHQYLANNAHP